MEPLKIVFLAVMMVAVVVSVIWLIARKLVSGINHFLAAIYEAEQVGRKFTGSS